MLNSLFNLIFSHYVLRITFSAIRYFLFQTDFKRVSKIRIDVYKGTSLLTMVLGTEGTDQTVAAQKYRKSKLIHKNKTSNLSVEVCS